jgi:DHA2 family multidrug resistance protein-like MFS transporter
MDPAPRVPKVGRAWLGLLVLILPCLLVSIDLTVLNLAVPSLTADLDPTGSQLLWIVDIYGFLVAGSLITMGALGDRMGRRRLLLIGSFAFGAVSLLTAFSTSPEMLIVARALLGIAGASVMPSTVALIRSLFDSDRSRSLAIGCWSASFSVGWAIGPLIGGFLLEHYWWGAVFLPAVPITALILIVGPRVLPESRDTVHSGLDVASAALSLFAILTAVYGIKRAATMGISAESIIAFVIGLILALIFWRRQTASLNPMIDFGLFRSRQFTAAVAANFLATATSVAMLFFVAQYFQLVLGYSPLKAGLWSLPIAIASFIACLGAPIVARRFSVYHVCIVGLMLAALALVIIGSVGHTSGVRLIAAAVLLTTGLGPVVTLATDLIVSAAPPDQAARATATSETALELGGAIGIALFGTASIAIYRRDMAETLPGALSFEEASAARETLSAALELGHRLPDSLGIPLIASARHAFVNGIQVSSMIGLCLVVMTAVVAFTLMRIKTPMENPIGLAFECQSDGAIEQGVGVVEVKPTPQT